MRLSLAKETIKVCHVAISLGKGGSERSTALLTKMFAEANINNHLAILNDEIDYDFDGTLYNMGLEKQGRDTIYKRFFRIIKFRKYLLAQNFDFIIDSRTRYSPLKEWLYQNYVYRGFKTIYMVRSYHLKRYLPHWGAHRLITKAYQIVGVSEAISNLIQEKYPGHNNIRAIYNTISIAKVEEQAKIISYSQDYILALGRLDNAVKNYSLLLKAYKLSDLPAKDIKLFIMGKGPDKEVLVRQINEMELSKDVRILPFDPNPFPRLKHACFTVLTSHHEGFPRVLIESLALETPVISVNCKSGPDEIIKNGINGLLVENYDPKALALAFNKLIFDKALYNTCKANAKLSITFLVPSRILKLWKELLKV